MKTYEIEICRTSYITLTVEAENEEQAEEKAWKEIEAKGDEGDAHWECESIEEVKGARDESVS
jgi:hypothetical protein